MCTLNMLLESQSNILWESNGAGKKKKRDEEVEKGH